MEIFDEGMGERQQDFSTNTDHLILDICEVCEVGIEATLLNLICFSMSLSQGNHSGPHISSK